MADSEALRVRRSRRHRAGDHSLCRQLRGPETGRARCRRRGDRRRGRAAAAGRPDGRRAPGRPGQRDPGRGAAQDAARADAEGQAGCRCRPHRDCSAPCKPRFATPATPAGANLAAGIGKTAELLGFRTSLGPGLMPWQHDVNAVTTELTADGRFAYRQVVIEVMRQQGKSVDLLAMMIARGLRRPGTQIAYTAQTRLDARHRLLDVWWPRIAAVASWRRSSTSAGGRGRRRCVFRNGSMLGLVSQHADVRSRRRPRPGRDRRGVGAAG